MPVLLLERLPLPSLEAYAVVSVSLLGLSLHYAAEKTQNPEWRMQFVKTNSSQEIPNSLQAFISNILSRYWLSSRAQDIVSFSIHDSLCIWIVVNMAYCLLVLFGNWLQKQVFGELRVSELQHIKDKFWNFVFYKFIFIFGIKNVQSMEGVILWGSWFSVIGFLHIHAQLCQDRFEYLSMTPCTPRNRHIRLLTLLGSILVASGLLFLICLGVGQRAGWITFALVAPECLLLALRTTHVIFRYILYLQSCHPPIHQISQGWSPSSYYVELAVEISCLVVDLAHHIHMLLRANMLLSMASLVIFMQLRVLYEQLCGRLRRHGNYKRLLKLVELCCPLETLHFELESEWEDNKCAICWEAAAVARRLPCGHHFHHGCLLHWLEQDPTCPTCRRQLLEDGSKETTSSSRPRETASFISWTGWNRLFQQNTDTPVVAAAENSQLEALADQVLQLFPDYSFSVIVEDLRQTRSVDLTVENILEGRLLPTLPSFQQEPSLSTLPTFVRQENQFDVSQEPEKLFVDDPQERQHILQCRKHELIAEARNRFLQRQALENNSTIIES
ncbi:E3 ubiquitin-protein ligase AMFR-like [Daphnia pulicaria]|uniref:E3 ubiquitin-protein ligase AMFR-like n=1 Tax=Daphnia pulicaria TaxID=35523 RepID=UPI001EEC4B58|nr:E3 ubiquitin-protein ligase AMFR-like [Daphnia pulicaria]